MPQNSIFSVPYIYKINLPGLDKACPVDVKLGAEARVRKYALVGATGGAQPFRTQYDVAVDGTAYALTAGKGVGAYQFTLLEGAIQDCDNNTVGDSFMEDYKKLKGYRSRKLVIVTYGVSTRGTTETSMTFTGIIDNVLTTVLVDEQTGQSYTQIQITASGLWE